MNTKEKQSQKSSTKWAENKVKGDLAEAVCRTHFEALGYAVENTGIEHIAPQLCALNKIPKGNHIALLDEIRNQPDFLISRQRPWGRSGNKADVYSVEAKFRAEVVFKEFTEEMLDTYSKLIDRRTPFIVYLVCKTHDGCSDPNHDGFVFLNFFNPYKGKASWGTGWKQAGNCEDFSKLPPYRGQAGGPDFNQAYREIVHPGLCGMLGK